MSRAPVALTAGEPAGIGPELCAAMAVEGLPIVLVGDRGLFESRAACFGLTLDLPDWREGGPTPAILHLPMAARCIAGVPDPTNAPWVVSLIDCALDGCVRGEFSALTTGPVQKSVIAQAGIPFSGHTEYLAGRLGVRRVVMLLVGGGLRVALATTHLPLRAVADAINQDALEQTLRILARGLRERFGIPAPRILVAGVNPHAGESGHLGREEIEVIAPVVERLRSQGMQLEGPLPADTLFQQRYLERADAVLAMYHDQGLPVLKHASFGAGVNVTLGLPVIRTSPDHGTALDLAGTGRADAGSLRAAVSMALGMTDLAP
ncbi:MAG: 4-hydroxythreonine-4-phosphate dehydrogenase PdxA [Betaproteobacteria bacterium]|nr:4-hydroxythreonine-4-phosphate dehydrogenase PdxA [Betaproteobacteria bacterium]